MMLYTYLKGGDGSVIRLEADCQVPSQLRDKINLYAGTGCMPTTAEEFDKQTIEKALKMK